MTIRTISGAHKTAALPTARWLQIGLQAAVGAILAVLLAQVIILALWPELAPFKPLDSYARSVIFTFVPAMAATAVFSWLIRTRGQPVKQFLSISTIVLLLSFLPDYLLPVPNRTFWASTAAASLHLVAGVVTVTLILAGYVRSRAGGAK